MKAVLVALSVFCCVLYAGEGKTKRQEFGKRINEVDRKYTQDDVTAEIKFGRDLAARILGKYEQITDKKVIDYVSKIGTGISAQVGRPELTFYFTVINTDDVNAYACPGGYVFLTKGALKMMKNEAQLAGVLAHEITHINNKHVVKQLNIKGTDSSALSGLASITSGATSSARVALEQMLDNAVKLLFEKGVEARDEFECDEAATNILVSLNYDWKSYRDYIAALRQVISKGNGKVISKTHPRVEDRLREIDKTAAKLAANNIKGKTNKKRLNEYVRL